MEIKRHKSRIFCGSGEALHANNKDYSQYVFLVSVFVTLLSLSTHDNTCWFWQVC